MGTCRSWSGSASQTTHPSFNSTKEVSPLRKVSKPHAHLTTRASPSSTCRQVSAEVAPPGPRAKHITGRLPRPSRQPSAVTSSVPEASHSRRRHRRSSRVERPTWQVSPEPSPPTMTGCARPGKQQVTRLSQRRRHGHHHHHQRRGRTRGQDPGVARRTCPVRPRVLPVSYTHLRAHETRHDLVCRLLLEKKKKKNKET